MRDVDGFSQSDSSAKDKVTQTLTLVFIPQGPQGGRSPLLFSGLTYRALNIVSNFWQPVLAGGGAWA